MVETCLEPHSHPQFLIIPTLSTSLETLHFDPPARVLLCVCVCVFFGICELGVACTQFWFALSSDLWIGCCVCTILVLRSCGCCVCEWSGQCLPPAVMSVRRQARGRSGDACMRHVGNARNVGWKKPSAILRNSNSSPLCNCVVLDCSARQLCVRPRVVTCFIYPPRRSR
jgi:hypothetical protein